MLKILVVDDETEITAILQRFFQRKNYKVFVANDGVSALDIVKAQRPHLVFLDICMPGLDGLSVLRDINSLDTSIKVIMVTALEDETKMREAKSLGAIDYVRKPFNLEYLERDVIEKINVQLFEDLRQELQGKSVLIEQLAQEVSQVNQLNKKLKRNFYQTILSLATALESRDRYTYGHSERVDLYSKAVAWELKELYGWPIDEKFLDDLHIESRLHDIGKIAVPDTVLNKSGELTIEEYELIKVHAVKSAHILNPLEDLAENINVIKHHHERIDGRGYPDGLKGEVIPVRSRIIAVADSFDAMTSDRPYRKAMQLDEAIAELEKNRGIQFDIHIVNAFVSVYRGGKLPS